jgi:Family of unknown function (DUF6152)
MRLFVAAFVLAAVVPVRAHHPTASYYDVSQLVLLTGVVVEARIGNPHVVLIVDGTTPDGRSGLWAFEGPPPNAFLRRGPKDFREKLRTGTRITISGWAAKDPTVRAFSGRDVTFADGSKMLFGGPPNESGWRCDSPCPYKYPDVPSR